MLDLEHLEKSFDGIPAISDLSLNIREDEYLTLLGPSGSGKSVLLRLISGLDELDSGRIHLRGSDITHTPSHMRGLGFVQQKYGLFPHINVLENIAFGLKNRMINPLTDNAEIERRTKNMLHLVGLEGLEDRMVGQISGGQKQRVSLARTLITEPKICLLDEPLGALDANLRTRMTVELKRIRESLGVTFLHVTGNETEALAMGDRVIVLDKGVSLQVATPDLVFSRPATVNVARHVNNYNILEGKSDGGVLHANGAEIAVGVDHNVRYCAIGYDRITIGEEVSSGFTGLKAEYIASEFIGSKVIYLFKTTDGKIFEVEKHLSLENPMNFKTGEHFQLSWHVDDMLFFDEAGALIPVPEAKEAANG